MLKGLTTLVFFLATTGTANARPWARDSGDGGNPWWRPEPPFTPRAGGPPGPHTNGPPPTGPPGGPPGPPGPPPPEPPHGPHGPNPPPPPPPPGPGEPGGPGGPNPPPPPHASPYTYVSLGSSFAAGAGITPYTDSAALRSTDNYGSVFARMHPEINHVDLSVSGSILSHLYQTSQVMGGVTYPPRTDLIPADTKLITITSAGNDINYIGGMYNDGNRTGPDTQTMIQNYKTAINAIKAKAPHAKILLVEYVTLLGNEARAGPVTGVNFTPERTAYHAAIGDELQQITVGAANGEHKVYVLHVAAASMANAVGSPVPWSNGFDGPRPGGDADDAGSGWHPNRRVMRAVAGLLDAWYNLNK